MITEKENQLASTQTKVFSEMTKEQRQDEEEFQELLIRAEHLKDVKKGPKPKQTKEKVFNFIINLTRSSEKFLYSLKNYCNTLNA